MIGSVRIMTSLYPFIDTGLLSFRLENCENCECKLNKVELVWKPGSLCDNIHLEFGIGVGKNSPAGSPLGGASLFHARSTGKHLLRASTTPADRQVTKRQVGLPTIYHSFPSYSILLRGLASGQTPWVFGEWPNSLVYQP